MLRCLMSGWRLVHTSTCTYHVCGRPTLGHRCCRSPCCRACCAPCCRRVAGIKQGQLILDRGLPFTGGASIMRCVLLPGLLSLRSCSAFSSGRRKPAIAAALLL